MPTGMPKSLPFRCFFTLLSWEDSVPDVCSLTELYLGMNCSDQAIKG
uniref:Uncharacterized protein n=1 Tax=Rhizophora mucronata TaxID=61149 RepID=A0A2P2Q5G3_RHIMU